MLKNQSRFVREIADLDKPIASANAPCVIFNAESRLLSLADFSILLLVCCNLCKIQPNLLDKV